MRIRSFFVVLWALLAPVPASALCTGFGVTASSLAFAVYDPAAAAPATSTSTIDVKCGIGLLPAFTIALSAGNGSYAQREMTFGVHMLAYNLYTGSAHLTVWGDGTSGTVTQGFSGLLALGDTDYTVYGAIGANQYPAPGAYADTIVVTVSF